MDLQLILHSLGSLDALYLHDKDSGQVALSLLPAGMQHRFTQRRRLLHSTEILRLGLQCPAWHVGSLCHLALRHHPQALAAGMSALDGYSTHQLRYVRQKVFKDDGQTRIETILHAQEGYDVVHTLCHADGEGGVEVTCRFENHTGQTVRLELLTSFALDDISPFAIDDAPCSLQLHRFYGGWSAEGRCRSDSLESLNLERAWFNSRPSCERFGSYGSYPVDRYFPFAAVEDTRNHVVWAAQLASSASWQMELYRSDDGVLFAGGLPDNEFGGWFKNIPDGVSFTAPKAYLSVVHGDLQDACNQIKALHRKYVRKQPYGEQTLPVICNEWCTSWGHPSEAEILALAERLKQTPVGYLVIDAGWSKSTENYLGQSGNGDWELDPEKFPHGLLSVSRRVQQLGMKLGIWFEFEVTTRGARVFGVEYDALHLARGGKKLLCGPDRSFWDFRKQEVRDYLTEKVLTFLQKNEITYLKVDYNGSIGAGCDGAESPGEGLRQQMQAVQAFFCMLRREYPQLVIENCASGGHRLEPSMMDITALSSGSDAHECLEIPILAANTDLLILPQQNEIWCVLDRTHTPQQLRFRLAATFLGRFCISGDVLTLSEALWQLVLEAMHFYSSCTNVLRDGSVRVVQAFKTKSIRYPKGIQAVTISTQEETLLVCHSFAEAETQSICVPLPAGHLRVVAQFGDHSALYLEDDTAQISGMHENDAFALLIRR